MLIQCTKKLLDRLKIQPEDRIEENPLYSWHANLIHINRRQTVVLMNDQTQYVIVLYGLKAKDFANIHQLIEQGIREVFLAEGMSEEIIDTYVQQAGQPIFTKTKDRSLVARLSKACESAMFYEQFVEEKSPVYTQLSLMSSRNLVGKGKNNYMYPNKELYNELQAVTDGPIFRVKAAELKVTLMLENHRVWRRLVVPLNRTFDELHDILQIVFNWKDYHLHEFHIFDESVTNLPLFYYMGNEYRPIVQLVSHEEAFAYKDDDMDMKMETEIPLSTYMPKSSIIVYVYDLGDNWQHKIEVVKQIDDYEVNHPICLEGEGNTPPEDVGGEGGYDEFLRVMANPDDPEHHHVKQWSESQGYAEFDMDAINYRLKGK